jgi:hypothetical protein
LHELPLGGGGRCAVKAESLGDRRFRLAPYPFDEAEVSIGFPARHVAGKRFGSAAELQAAYARAEVQELTVTVCG